MIINAVHNKCEQTTCERRYVCTRVCGIHDRYTGHLNWHMGTHAGEKPYKCTQCDYMHMYSQQLSKHREIHKSDIP